MKGGLLYRIVAAATLLIGLTAAGGVLTACSEMVPQSQVVKVDSLNAEAYNQRFRDPAKSSLLARQALSEASFYRTGRAEACNNLGMAAFMRMEYGEALRCFDQAEATTEHQTELLMADVGRMKLCQRTSRNKEFYDYRNRALQRLKRISEEGEEGMSAHEQERLRSARSELFITSATYYYYLQQQEDARQSMELLQNDRTLPLDTGQWLYAAYLEGAAALMEPTNEHDRRLRCFDLLYTTYLEAHQAHQLYIEGNALQGMANLMTSAKAFDFFCNHRRHELTHWDIEVDSLLPLFLAREALTKFKEYGDPYQVANGYVTVSRYLNDHGCYTEALDSLGLALQWANSSYTSKNLEAERNSVHQTECITVPECLLRIDEQLSVSHAGLGDKVESDRFRNRYLDMMERTRQDRELENRLETLERESAQLNLSLGLLTALLFTALLLMFLLRRHRRSRQLRMLLRMRRLIALCRTITSSIPPTTSTPHDAEEMLLQAIALPLRPLFGQKNPSIREKQLCFREHLSAEEQAMLKVINPYVEWAIDNNQAILLLEEQRISLEEQRAIHELHIAAGKRQNVAKRACLSVVNGILPFIDRILHEVNQLRNEQHNDDYIEQRKHRLHYINELSTTINEYNDILAYWIKMRQGELNLHIETFALNELFQLIAKGSRAFQLKRQQLTVCPTHLKVKADKALTLFMLNTLTENARKYTPEGGSIRVEAREVDSHNTTLMNGHAASPQCVEIAVIDDGPGLSPADVQLINEKKIYDPARIGTSGNSEQVERIQQAKGSGFGLMNCKGIIEKYRKSSALFSCCSFRVESRWGQGCRFIFRLPMGMMLLLGVLLTNTLQLDAAVHPTDELLNSTTQSYAEALLDTASTYADKAYFSNVEGRYTETILYADSAISYLNRHLDLCRKQLPLPYRQLAPMQLTGDNEAAELTWWHTPYDSDFHIILDVRNEAAVAFLALKQWEAYRYNNFAYTSLYKLLGEDRSLESYCQTLQRHTDHKSVALICSILLLLFLIGGYVLVAFRRRMLTQWNLEQVLDITHRLYASTMPQPDEERLRELPQQMMTATYDAFRAILPLHCMGVAYYNESNHRLEVTFHHESRSAAAEELLHRCYEAEVCIEEGEEIVLPLLLKQGEHHRCIGALYLQTDNDANRSTNLLLLQLITDYWSVVLYNAVMKISGKYRDIESASDETRRASWEENKLHVQNLVLDNCLSTIKHETIYYPNKIKQLATQLEEQTTEEIGELIVYYKGIFTLLNQCADRQVDRGIFRRRAISVHQLGNYAERFYIRCTRSMNLTQPPRPFAVEYVPETSSAEDQVWGDEELLRYLLECLIRSQLALPAEALQAPLSPDSSHHAPKACTEAAPLTLRITSDDNGFIRFTLCDPLHSYSNEELNNWFHPQMKQILRQAHGKCEGTEYLIAKQIIRQHDELAGHRGCRINALPLQPQGMAIYFTLPLKQAKEMNLKKN
ncbi:MAG: DUF5112 domain-containing protein [Bacteroides sp.]